MRKLAPTTIIPTDLYVERSADLQLRNIIQQAGRPGYILVSRQMGKTSLLINAKNRLSDQNNPFVYVDLSVSFSSAQECFRHIIDTAISTHEQQFGHLRKVFDLKRLQEPTLAYKEHESELIEMLKNISGNMVIILDEIDALKTSTFSDQVFAQIRSMYFARVNYPVLSRLTYILSGVAEPKDLIKNKEMSPFNIGEKIFLDDFSKEEFDSFIAKSQLDLKDDVAGKIYHWCNGNPRMTWDICSAVEERLLEKETITTSDVDEIVQELYLTKYDIAPVDHIRTLVEEDEDLQNALMEIRYLKSDALSDAAKSKLYLAGIVGAKRNKLQTTIKNPIIDASLSDSWLKSITRKRKSLQQLAQEKFENSEYATAIGFFEQALTDPNLSPIDIRTNHLMLAHCYFEEEKYSKALQSFKNSLNDKDAFAQAYFDNLSFQGHCYYRLNDHEKAIECYRTVAQSPLKNMHYFNSLINLGTCLGEIDRKKNTQKIIEIFKDATETLLKTAFDSEKDRNLLIVTASFSLGQAYLNAKNKLLALQAFSLSQKYASPNEYPAVIAELIDLESDSEKKTILLKSVFDTIQENSVTLQDNEVSPLAYSTRVLSRLLEISYKLKELLLFRNFVEHFMRYIRRMETPNFQEVADFAESWFRSQKHEIGFIFIKEVVDKYIAFIDNEFAILELYRLISLNMSPEFDEYFRVYKTKLSSQNINEYDIAIGYSRVSRQIELEQFDLATDTIAFYKSIRPLNSTTSSSLAVFLILEMNMLLKQGLNTELRNKARETAEEIERILPKVDDGLIFKHNFFAGSLAQANTILNQRVRPFIKESNYERNQKVRVQFEDGRIEEVKYKKIESALKAGLCKLV